MTGDAVPPPSCIGDVDWSNWRPEEEATLLFVIRGRQVLLIRKKRGLGAGNINGPGGRLEPGELPIDGAVRELQEELLITAIDVRPAGVLRFQFADGFSIAVHVFTAADCLGEPRETAEAAAAGGRFWIW